MKPPTLAATPSRLSTPRLRSTSSVGAAIEKGTSFSNSSRFIAVTVTTSVSMTSIEISICAFPPGASSTSCVLLRKPESDAATV